ncbi:hypothetical protein WMY93_014417 [Mugilogobius chulae]|uniref:Uncharacterized protein n=1 Tax=Mugilogobius chulae TaxID=88201 RepID=A0AAW0P4D9_9GOBI
MEEVKEVEQLEEVMKVAEIEEVDEVKEERQVDKMEDVKKLKEAEELEGGGTDKRDQAEDRSRPVQAPALSFQNLQDRAGSEMSRQKCAWMDHALAWFGRSFSMQSVLR